jgi:hypothetical protein
VRDCEKSELPDGFTSGFHYTAPLATMPVYLDYLRARFERAGGTLEVSPVASLADLAGAAPVVVNCSGAAAHDLVPDPAVMPVRGQVVIAANPGIEEFLVSRDPEPPWIVYMFPHGDTILLGGTNEEGNWDTDPKPEVTERIVAGCTALEPRLRGVEIVGHRVGLRPWRPEVRLESESFGDGVLWHNYGHGGAGISMAWGCAAEITKAASVRTSLAVQKGGQPGGRDDAVGVLAELGDLGPVGVAVEADADPAAAADVGRPEEALRVGRGELLLRPRWRRAPQVRELVVVMAVGPERREGAFAADEPGRRAMAGPLGDLGQGQADHAEPFGQIAHPLIVPSATGIRCCP